MTQSLPGRRCSFRTGAQAAAGALLALCAFLAPSLSAAAEPIALHKLEWSFVPPDPAAAAGNEASGAASSFSLPLRWRSEADSPLRFIALRGSFPLERVPERPFALLLAHATEGGRFSINGHFIGSVPVESARWHVAWRRPQLLAIDPSQLLPGDNEIQIETTYGPGEHLFAGIEVGPLDELWGRYALLSFASRGWSWIATASSLLIAIVFGALWLRRRESVSLLLTLAAASWLLYCAGCMIEVMPAELRAAVRLAVLAGTAAFFVLLSALLLRLGGAARARWEWPMWAFAAAGPLLFLVTSTQADAYLERLWQPGMIALLAWATGTATLRRAQGRPAPQPLALVAATALVIAGLADSLGVTGAAGLDVGRTLDYAAPLALLALAAPLIDRFMKTMDETEAARVELETRVREREQLLKRNFERLRESERIKVQAQERQRIMQDMHDGLGSQLMSSLMLVERGAVSNEQFAQILRESIDDMRLAIDALAAEDTDLAAALGNLRFRMEPRLRAAGMELTWDARRLPEELSVHPDIVLPILRIVQEALTNSLKHSHARAVRVTLTVEGAGDARWLDIRVADNGRGIGEERAGGRGLLNMRNRAQKIGASLKLETAVNVGTVVHLRTRIGAHAPEAPTGQTVLNTQAIIERARQSG